MSDEGLGTGRRLSAESVKPAVLRGVRWVSLGRGGTELLGFASTVVLARLVPPSEYGHAVLAMVVCAVGAVLGGQVAAPTLVRRASITPDHVGTAVTLQLVAGALLSAVVVLAAGVISPGNEGLIRLVAPAVLLSSVGAVPTALLQRELDFRRMSLAQLVGVVVGASAAVCGALLGLDAEAIVIGPVVTASCSALVVTALVRLPRPRWSRPAASDLLGFGLAAGASTALHTVFQNIDYTIVAARLSPAGLAYYFRAFTLSVNYQAKVSQILANMSFPIYARLERDAVRTMRRRIVRVHTTALFPLLTAYLAVAPWLVPTVFGGRWDAAVVPSQILVLAGMAGVISTGNGALIMASGRAGLMLRWNASNVVGYGICVWLGAGYGLDAAAAAASGYLVLRTVATHLLVIDRHLGIPFGEFVRDLGVAGVPSLALLAVAAPVASALAAIDVPGAAIIVVAPLLGLGTYVLALRTLSAATFDDLLTLGRTLLPRRAVRSGQRADMRVNDSSAVA